MFLLVMTLSSCRLGHQPEYRTEMLLGTVCNIIVHDRRVDTNVFDQVFERVAEIENLMSLNYPESDVSQINRAAGNTAVVVSEETFYVIQQARHFAKITSGAFDITIGPLVKLWDITSGREIIPNQTDIEALLPLVDYNAILLDEEKQTVMLEKEHMSIDLGGIAKGYAVDEAVRILKEHNIKKAIVDFGGDIFTIGQRPDDSPWRIGIQDPVDAARGNYIGIYLAEDQSIVTSGDYERFFEKEGRRYHHILDPETGFPAQAGLRSVTVAAADALTADTLSTAVYIMGLTEGLSLIESLSEVEGVLVTKENHVHRSSGIGHTFSLQDESFTLKQ